MKISTKLDNVHWHAGPFRKPRDLVLKAFHAFEIGPGPKPKAVPPQNLREHLRFWDTNPRTNVGTSSASTSAPVVTTTTIASSVVKSNVAPKDNSIQKQSIGDLIPLVALPKTSLLDSSLQETSDVASLSLEEWNNKWMMELTLQTVKHVDSNAIKETAPPSTLLATPEITVESFAQSSKNADNNALTQFKNDSADHISIVNDKSSVNSAGGKTSTINQIERRHESGYTIPVYSANVSVHKAADGILEIKAKDGVIKAMLQYVLAREGTPKLLDLLGTGNTNIVFGLDGLGTMYETLDSLFTPKEVQAMTSTKNPLLVTKEANSSGSALITGMYQSLEVGEKAFGDKTIAATGKNDAVQKYIHDYLADGVKLHVVATGTKNGEKIRSHIINVLQQDKDLIADLAASGLLGIAQNQKIPPFKVLLFVASLITSAGLGSLYELLVSENIKALFTHGIDPHELQPGLKALSLAIDILPQGLIETSDSYGNLLLMYGKNPEDTSYSEVGKKAVIAGGWSSLASIPSYSLQYVNTNGLGTAGKAGMAVISAAFDFLQVIGAILAVVTESREVLTANREITHQLIQDGVLAKPSGDMEKHVESLARQWFDKNPETALAAAAVALSVLVSLGATVMGPNGTDVVPEDKMRISKSAVFQPFESIAWMIMTSLANYASKNVSRFLTNTKDKVEKRTKTIFEKRAAEGSNGLTKEDNDSIDKVFLGALGRHIVEWLTFPIDQGIKYFDVWGVRNDVRDTSKIPYQSRLDKLPKIVELDEVVTSTV